MTFILSKKYKPKLVDNNILKQITKQNFLTAMKMRKTSILMINDKYSLKTHDESRKE